MSYGPSPGYKSTRMTFIFAILGPNHRVELGDGAAQLHKFRPRSHSSCRARPRGGRTLRNRTQCLMSQQFLLRRECMDKSKSLLQQNQTEIGEVMLLPGCTLTETYRILTDPRRSPTFQRVIAKSTRTSAACATCTQ